MSLARASSVPAEAHREILSDIKSNDTEVTDLLSQATGVLNKRIQSEQPSTRRDNRRGVILLIVSVFLLTAAVVLQVFTDPSFHEGAVKPIRTRPPGRRSVTHQSDRQYPMQRGFGRSCSSCRRLKT